jgi:hypothetical protein
MRSARWEVGSSRWDEPSVKAETTNETRASARYMAAAPETSPRLPASPVRQVDTTELTPGPVGSRTADR